jgi:RNA recognition motif-containing protein
MFAEFGEVESFKIIKDFETGRSKGFGFCEMADETEGLRAIQALDGKEYSGRALSVKKARERREKRWGTHR